jgi:phage terminase large subunit-like protein
LILAGRGFGKTRTGAEWVRANMYGDTPLTGGRWRHVALIAETAADARDVMVGDGKMLSDPNAGSGILQVHQADFRPTYELSERPFGQNIHRGRFGPLWWYRTNNRQDRTRVLWRP